MNAMTEIAEAHIPGVLRWNIVMGDRLLYRGRDWRFDGRRGDALDWITERTNERLELTFAELSAAVTKGQAEIKKLNRFGCVDDGPTVDFETLSAENRLETNRRYQYVTLAINDGFTGSIKEDELALAIKGWAVDLLDPKPPSTKSLRRWLKKAGDRVTVGKLITNHAAKGRRGCQLDAIVEEIVEWSIDVHYKKFEKPCIASVVEHVRYHIDRFNRENGHDLPKPGPRAVQRAIERRSPQEIMAAREGKAQAEQRFEEIKRLLDPEAPLDVVELDHTKADLIVIDDVNFQVLGRPTLALTIDRCTRMAGGLYIGFEPPSIHTVMQCLKNTMCSKDYVDDLVASGKWKLKNRWLVSGFIRTLVLDRAMENLSFTVREWAKAMGTKIVLAGSRKARQKGAIERFIRTLTKDLLHEQSGTTFSNIIERAGYDSKKYAVVTFSELNRRLHHWLIDRYQVKPHRGFFVSDIPQRLWNEKIEVCPPDPTPNLSEIGHLFGRRFKATLQPWGLTLRYLEFVSPELVGLLSDPDFVKAHPDRKMLFSIGNDLTEIFAYVAHQKRWLRVPISEKWRAYATGLHWASHLFIIAARRERTAKQTDLDALAEAKAEICGWVRQTVGSKSVSTSSKAARISGVGRQSPAGDDPNTTVPGSFEDERQAVGARKRRTRPVPHGAKDQAPQSSTFVEVLDEAGGYPDTESWADAESEELFEQLEEV